MTISESDDNGKVSGECNFQSVQKRKTAPYFPPKNRANGDFFGEPPLEIYFSPTLTTTVL